MLTSRPTLAATFAFAISVMSVVKRLWADQDGLLGTIIGLSALAFSASRLMDVETQLQKAADALALAGAAEFDRRPDSISLGRPALGRQLDS